MKILPFLSTCLLGLLCIFLLNKHYFPYLEEKHINPFEIEDMMNQTVIATLDVEDGEVS